MIFCVVLGCSGLFQTQIYQIFRKNIEKKSKSTSIAICWTISVCVSETVHKKWWLNEMEKSHENYRRKNWQNGKIEINEKCLQIEIFTVYWNRHRHYAEIIRWLCVSSDTNFVRKIQQIVILILWIEIKLVWGIDMSKMKGS